MIRTVDLNADLGEGMPWDIPLLARVTSANVSCGAHAGEPAQIMTTLLEASRHGVVVGAHPSWPDREGFGRVERQAKSTDVESLVLSQVSTLKAMADQHGIVVRYIKPHGALYNQSMSDDPDMAPIAIGLLEAARHVNLPLVGLPNTSIERMAHDLSVRYVREGFPDRQYDAAQRLVPRSKTNALVRDRCDSVSQAMTLVKSGVESLCIHGDSPGAVALADAILAAFSAVGMTPRSFVSPD